MFLKSQFPRRLLRGAGAACFLITAGWSTQLQADATLIAMDIDATALPRYLLNARLNIPVKPGRTALWYPEWVPGVHGPSGQLANLGKLEVTTAEGARLPWKRDDERMNKFLVEAPDGVSSIAVDLGYITNQPTQTSAGVGSDVLMGEAGDDQLHGKRGRDLLSR